LEKILRLKSASMLLFWFGIFAEFFILAGAISEYAKSGTFHAMSFEFIFQEFVVGILFLFYSLFVHLFHIAAGYLLARGLKIGIILGISVSLYEIVTFAVPEIVYEAWLTPFGLAIRIIFIIVLILIIIGRNDYKKLERENWRPWKNPLTPNRKVTEKKST